MTKAACIEEYGIQMGIFDYFENYEEFTLAEAEAFTLEHMEVKKPSIRARIYEGIHKGLFERLGRGVYKVVKDDVTCAVIEGDGRDLSVFEDNSVDAIITDHPYDLPKCHKGGNRNFTESYDCFTYEQKDFDEKARILKDGCFLVEFAPEENADNFEMIYNMKKMAIKAGFEYYACVPWKKGDFVANTGRKAKNTENLLIFTKGKARSLRPDAKKDKAKPEKKHYMAGAAGMFPTVFDVAPVVKAEKIHQAEKPVDLIRQLLEFITLPEELVLDQFAGSGVTGEAALSCNRNAILIEKDNEMVEKIKARLNDFAA